ncbi:MAG: tetratricopeptide (TPR) repeat protein [Phycisphaerales bacterium]
MKSAARVAEALRGELDWIIMRAIDKDRTRRYETAASFARDIHRYLDGEPVEAKPASASYRLSKFARRHKGSIAAGSAIGAALVLALVLGLVAALVGLGEANRQARIANANYDEARVVTNFLTRALQSADPSKMGKDVKVAEILDDAAKTLASPEFEASDQSKARLHHTLCVTYMKLGVYEDAVFHARRAIEIRLEIFGPDHLDTLEIQANLVSTLNALGRVDEAEAMSDALIARLEALLETDPEAAKAVFFGAANTHGVIKRHQQDFETALRYEELALAAVTEIHGPNHAKTIGILQNIATTLSRLGRDDEAMAVAQDSVRRSEDHLGHDSIEAILSREAVAGQHFRTGHPELSLPIYEANIEARKRLLGEIHPSTLTSQYNFAAVNFQLGNMDRAHEELVKVLEHVPEKLAYTHRVAMSAAALTGPVYIPADGSPPADEAMAQKIMDTIAADADSPFLLMDFGNGAATAMIQGRHIDPTAPSKALKISARVVAHAQENEHPNPAYFLDTHSHALFYSGDIPGAIEAERRAVEACPEDQPEVLEELKSILAKFEQGIDPNAPET